jgi:hypothetical protein
MPLTAAYQTDRSVTHNKLTLLFFLQHTQLMFIASTIYYNNQSPHLLEHPSSRYNHMEEDTNRRVGRPPQGTCLASSAPPLVVFSSARSPHGVSSTSLFLSTLLSFCCANWLLPVTLHLLLVSLLLLCPWQHPCCTGVFAVVALASLPIAPASTAIVHCRHQMAPSIADHHIRLKLHLPHYDTVLLLPLELGGVQIAQTWNFHFLDTTSRLIHFG